VSFLESTQTLLTAQQSALSHDQRIDTLNLRSVQRGVPSLPLADVLVSAKATLTIDGASTLELGIDDPAWLIEGSGLLDPDDNGRMQGVDITVDALPFRLAKASRSGDGILTLTFEDMVVQLLRAHRSALAASRGSMTRGQFIEKLVREVKTRAIPFFSPEKGTKQAVELPDYPDAKPSQGETGFDKGARLNVKGWNGSHVLDAAQMRVAATALGTAQQEGAKEKATMALLEALIVEAPFFSNPTGGDATSAGPLQLLSSHLGGSLSTHGGRRDTALVCRMFLKDGFSGKGGAIELAKAHPEWTAGQVAQACQGSAFPSRYDDSRAGARTVLAAYGGADGAGADEVVATKAYQFQRKKGESSWSCGVRLAEEVAWRFFTAGGVVWFVSDDYLVTKPASLIISGPDDAGILARPSYDWDHGKLAGNVELRVAANRWAVRPGEVVTVQNMGPVAGRWIVHTVVVDLFDATAVDITLVKPLAPKKEPAAELTTTNTDETSGPAGAARAVKWARSKLGHFAEEFGANRGSELDTLEKKFGMTGQPWCAMFATTAAERGGAPAAVRTAAVVTIRQWATEGSHGFTKGFRATPKPGDLMCFDTHHVGLVEKVSGDKIGTIEGNTSANKVARLTRDKSEGDFARPDYPT
jgi:CHAP domain